MKRAAVVLATLLASAALVPGCDSTSTADIQLGGGNSCTAVSLAEVQAVAVELWGGTPDAPCLLGRRCIPVSPRPSSIADIEAALKAADQPLVEADRGGVERIAILGFKDSSCGGDLANVCGAADLQTSATISIPVACDRVIIGDACSLTEPLTCP